MSFSVRSETAARIIQGMRPEELKTPGAVDRLVELAESDGKLSSEEKTALKGALQAYQQSGFDPAQKVRLEAYLGMTNAGVRHALAAGAVKDGVIDIADAQKALKAIQADGKISNTERMTVRSAMIAFKMKPEAAEALEKGIAEQVSGPFKDLQFKDAGLRNTLRSFQGVEMLGMAQVDALLASARDGTGISATEKQDLEGLYRNHSALLEPSARVKLAATLGISGLEGAPLGRTDISMRNERFTGAATLQFNKKDDGTMEVRLHPASIRDYGWLPVKADGTFEQVGDSSRFTGERDEWSLKGKVSFENGAFTAEAVYSEVHHRTRPQGSNDTPHWNSGNRVPYTNNYGDSFRTTNHPSLEGTRVFDGQVKRGGAYSNGPTTPVTLLRSAEGTFLQLSDSAPYNQRIPVGADGKIAWGNYTGQVSANGDINLHCSTRLSANYTENIGWSGRVDGFTP